MTRSRRRRSSRPPSAYSASICTTRRGRACWPRSRWSHAARAADGRRGPPRRRRPSPGGSTIPGSSRSRSTAGSCRRSTGPAPLRSAALSARHGLVTYEVLGHLIRLQARSALADFAGAGAHAAAADRLAAQHELPLVAVFTAWYRALRLAANDATAAEAAYREAAARLDGAGMPGLEHGALALALLCLDVRRGRPARAAIDWGPYEPWARPLVLLAEDRADEAAVALRATPEPPRDLLLEALWCLTAHAAVAVGDGATMERAYVALLPAAGELAGAGSGLVTLGPVAEHLAMLGR